jgi:hypothetical protein
MMQGEKLPQALAGALSRSSSAYLSKPVAIVVFVVVRAHDTGAISSSIALIGIRRSLPIRKYRSFFAFINA